MSKIPLSLILVFFFINANAVNAKEIVNIQIDDEKALEKAKKNKNGIMLGVNLNIPFLIFSPTSFSIDGNDYSIYSLNINGGYLYYLNDYLGIRTTANIGYGKRYESLLITSPNSTTNNSVTTKKHSYESELLEYGMNIDFLVDLPKLRYNTKRNYTHGLYVGLGYQFTEELSTNRDKDHFITNNILNKPSLVSSLGYFMRFNNKNLIEFNLRSYHGNSYNLFKRNYSIFSISSYHLF